jgi:hypothetical protein
MFIIEETNIAGAIKRAKDLHPKVRMIEFGVYSVTGSKGNTYTVRCQRQSIGKVVDCTCKTKDFTACKHAMAAVSLHIEVARRRKEA